MSVEQEFPKLFDPLPAELEKDPNAAEEALLELWRREGTFEKVQAARAGKPPFVFWEGPPTANGRPGIHHVIARTLKDAVCRYHTMLGKRVDRKAGWDTHGLPVELEVEKALKISGKPEIEKYGVAEFNQKCRESVWKYREEWERLSERIGYWLDYAHPYITYEATYIDSVWGLLARMHKAGLVYRGKRVLPYCGRCGTGLSSHELGQPGVYQDVLDPSVHVRFPLREQTSSEVESFVAWTTTPWTIPSNIALAVHPEREYVRARVALPVHKDEQPGSRGHEIVWIVAERAEAVLGKDHEVLARKRGSDLVGTKYVAPFGLELPAQIHAGVPEVSPGSWDPSWTGAHQIVSAEYVTVEDGTGIVHQAPAYGVDDWATAQKWKLPVLRAVGDDGRFASKVGSVEHGTWFKDADERLMEDMKAGHFLFRKAHEKHSYPHCWRCSKPLYYFAAPAWYIRTTALKSQMIELNKRVRWVPPETGDKRFGEWLENNVDWNISRDRYWGTPLPFWVCENSACAFEVAVGSAEELKQLTLDRPILGTEGKPVFFFPAGFDPHKPDVDLVGFTCPKCANRMVRTSAVLDAWFDSGAMPFAQYGWPNVPGSDARVREQFPADYICEGLDQTRGWFYTLHVIGTFMLMHAADELGPRAKDSPPYKTCLVNGLVLDKDGVKMSKRLGNVVDPWKVIAEHGADAVRWYLIASAAPWLPKKFDPSGIADVRRRFFSTLENSYAFLREYARVDRFDPADARIPSTKQRPEIDRWLVSGTNAMLDTVRERMDAVDLTAAARAIETFVVDGVSNWYIRRNRRRFWKGETGANKLAAFATLHYALSSVALAMAPLVPFLSEMLWRRLRPSAGTVHGQDLALPKPTAAQEQAIFRDHALEESMAIVQQIVVMGRALREKATLRVRQPLRALHVRSSDPRSLDLLATTFAREQILEELNIKTIGSLAADDGRLCRLTAKANFKLLGKRLGPRMKDAAAAIAALDAVALARLRAGERVLITVAGEELELTPEEVLVQVESQADFDVETDGRFVVWLDTQLDEELVLEGLAREVVNRVNSLRKERGLAVEDRIRLRVSPGTSPELALALERHSAMIANETLAAEILPLETLGAALEAAPRFDLGQERELRCDLARV